MAIYKEITLKIPEDIYKELKSAMTVKQLAMTAYGIQDSFMYRLLDKLEKGEKIWEVQYRKEVKK